MCCRYSSKVQYQKQDWDSTQEDQNQEYALQEQLNMNERWDAQDHGQMKIIEKQEGKTPEIMSKW